MKYFLLIFDRHRGEILEQTEFDDSSKALRARFAAERAGHDPNIEIVVLGAESAEALLLTHSRYFKSFGELARDGFDKGASLEKA